MKIYSFMRLAIVLIGLLVGIISNANAAALTTVDGQTIHPADLRGKWIVLNYWAGWCPSCQREVPDLNSFYQTHKDKNVLVFGVDYDQSALNELRASIKKMGIEFPVFVTDPGHIFGVTGVTGLPTTFIIAPNGKIVKTLVGEQTRSDFEKALAN